MQAMKLGLVRQRQNILFFTKFEMLFPEKIAKHNTSFEVCKKHTLLDVDMENRECEIVLRIINNQCQKWS